MSLRERSQLRIALVIVVDLLHFVVSGRRQKTVVITILDVSGRFTLGFQRKLLKLKGCDAEPAAD